MDTALALAAALAPPTPSLSLAPEETGFAPRFARFHERLPGLEARGVRLLLFVVRQLPRLVGPRSRMFLRLSQEERLAFVEALPGSLFGMGRHVAKALMLLCVPPYYAAPEVRQPLGDRTHTRVAKRDRLFPVEEGYAAWRHQPVIQADVVVVGSGAGGAPVAKELAERGHKVVVLEAGGYRPHSSFPGIPYDALVEMYRDAGALFSWGSPPIAVPVGGGIGGTTVINSGTCLRIPAFVHQRWEKLLQMPSALSHQALSPIYRRVEECIGVKKVWPELMGEPNHVIQKAAESLGWSGAPLPRNFRGCVGSNRCAFGCPTLAKQSMDLSYLPLAVAAGAQVIAGAKVERVMTDGLRATGVLAKVCDPEGRTKRLSVQARVVVLAAGTFNTPLLLRDSGFVHRSLGRRLTLHPAIKISGYFPGHNFFKGAGTPQSYCVDEYQREGVVMEGAHIPPDMLSVGLPMAGALHKAWMERSRELLLFGFMVSDEPSGWVQKGFGGRPFIRYDLSRRDTEKVVLGLQKLGRLFVEAGAEQLILPSWRHPVVPASDKIEEVIAGLNFKARELDMAAFHPLGTCGFGPDAAHFPLNCDLRFRGHEGLYVSDGSIFPTSLSVNPQLSIMAMATRLAFHLDDEVL